MHIVFKTIEDYWAEEEKQGRDLALEDKQDLKRLAESCNETLWDLEALLQKHRTLGTGSTLIARMRWAPRDIAPLRNRIILRTTLLASFNNTMTYVDPYSACSFRVTNTFRTKSNASQQRRDKAQLLEALNQIHRDFENGIRSTTAFSSMAIQELRNDDDDDVWNEVSAEIGSEGVEASSIDENRAFISNWLDRVILEEAREEDNYCRPGQSPSWTPSGPPPDESTWRLDFNSSRASRTNTMTSRNRDSNTLARKSHTSGGLATAGSGVSYTTKKRSWHPPDGPNREYVQRIFAKLLEETTSKPQGQDHSLLLAKRIYHQLDWYNLGFLLRLTVIEEFRLAVQAAQIPLGKEYFMRMVAAEGYKRNSSKVDQQEFINLMDQLLAAVKVSAWRSSQEEIDSADEESMKMFKETYHKVSSRTAVGEILPWGLKQSRVKKRAWHVNLGPERIIQLTTQYLALDAFAIMAYAVCRVFAPMIHQHLEDWAATTVALPRNLFNEYQQSLNTVLIGVSFFAVFENSEEAEDGLSKLDQFGSLIVLIPTDDLNEASRSDLTACPLEEFTRLRESCYEIMQSIGGFAYAMKCIQSKSFLSVENWREWRMQARAQRISQALASLGDVNTIIQDCEDWFEEHHSLTRTIQSALQNSVDLQSEQLRNLRTEDGTSRKTELDVTLELIEARDLPKGLFRTYEQQDLQRFGFAENALAWTKLRNPVVTVRPDQDTQETTPQLTRTCNPRWSSRFHWFVHQD